MHPDKDNQQPIAPLLYSLLYTLLTPPQHWNHVAWLRDIWALNLFSGNGDSYHMAGV